MNENGRKKKLWFDAKSVLRGKLRTKMLISGKKI
jgi:hypothetical protein